jgi:hypothetical protein
MDICKKCGKPRSEHLSAHGNPFHLNPRSNRYGFTSSDRRKPVPKPFFKGKTISFILPTNRPYKQYARKVIDSIFTAFNSCAFDIWVCSSENVNDKRVIWIQDKECSGSNYAINLASYQSKGDLICILVDDHFVGRNITEIVYDFKFDGSPEIGTLGSGATCYTGFKHEYFTKLHEIDIPRHLMVRFPIIPRQVLYKYLNGYVFHPSFQHQWQDNWLGIYAGEEGYNTFEVKPRLYKFDRMGDNGKPSQAALDDEVVMLKLMKKYKRGMSYTESIDI